MRTFCVADIHGEYQKLMDCLEIVNFDKQKDTLIQLGDVVDRGPDSFACIEELSTIKNLIAIKGNHDEMWLRFIDDPVNKGFWNQGGRETYNSYSSRELNPTIHKKFFEKQVLLYIDSKANVFVHGGFNRHYPLLEQPDSVVYTWDRDLWSQALSYESMQDKSYPFKYNDSYINEIFIGHTPVNMWGFTTPQKAANIWNLDTGAGKYENAKLTIMNVETKEWWQC